MEYSVIRAFDCPDAWYKALSEIWETGDDFKVRYGSETSLTKKLNLSIEILRPENRPLVDEKAPCNMEYVQYYALRYLWSGKRDDESYTYGSRLRRPVDQIEELIHRYLEEKNDRQITLSIRFPEDIKKEVEGRRHDPPCLSLIDTEILNDRLHLTCYFRSWDAYGGLPANIAGVQLLNEAIVSTINHRGNLDIQTGKLIFHSKNCHIYERQFGLVKKLMKPERRSQYNVSWNSRNREII